MAATLLLLGRLATTYIFLSIIYNLFFHPLAKVPGPFLSKISSWYSFYHACKGDRHIWLWQQFQIYGRRFRATPNSVMFNNPETYNAIFSHKANVQKPGYYRMWIRNENDTNTLVATDVEEHARKRRLLSLAFTDQSTRSAEPFIARHIDRWDELLVEGKPDKDGWYSTKDIAHGTTALFFDIMGDLSFGSNFNTKEPDKHGEKNEFKVIAETSDKYMVMNYSIARSPFADLILWLKPRGLNQLLDIITPKDIKKYFDFLERTVKQRVQVEKERETKKTDAARQDMFHYLFAAIDPETGKKALREEDIIAEANLLCIAGTDTSSNTTTGLLYYLAHNPRVYQKLTREIRSTFSSAEDIVGSKITQCKYLRACIDEALRLTPPNLSELPRVVRRGGITIDGDFYPEGVLVGAPFWAMYRNEEQYDDAYTFRPERWIVSEDLDTLNTAEDVQRLKDSFHPFSKGVGGCLGKGIAITQVSMAIARTIWRMDFRVEPGNTLGQGSRALGWGRHDPRQFQLSDAHVPRCKGPMLQFKKRSIAA